MFSADGAEARVGQALGPSLFRSGGRGSPRDTKPDRLKACPTGQNGLDTMRLSYILCTGYTLTAIR